MPTLASIANVLHVLIDRVPLTTEAEREQLHQHVNDATADPADPAADVTAPTPTETTSE